MTAKPLLPVMLNIGINVVDKLNSISLKFTNQNKCFLIILLISVFNGPIISCDCIPTSDKFVDNLDKTLMVIHARVIEHLESDKEVNRWTGFKGITKLLVIHSFKGKMWRDTLIHINTSPSFCGSSIQHLKKNQEVFLKVYLTDEFKLYKEFYLSEEKIFKVGIKISSTCEKYPNITSMNCDAAIIPVIDKKATGRITKKYSKEWKKYKRLSEKNSEKAEAYFDKHIRNKDLSEKFNIPKMYSLIEHKLSIYR